MYWLHTHIFVLFLYIYAQECYFRNTSSYLLYLKVNWERRILKTWCWRGRNSVCVFPLLSALCGFEMWGWGQLPIGWVPAFLQLWAQAWLSGPLGVHPVKAAVPRWEPSTTEQRYFKGDFKVVFFFGRCAACGILVPQPGIEPVPPAVEPRSLNCWTAREAPLRVAFWGTARLLSRAASPFCLSANGARWFQFLHILTTCTSCLFLYNNHPNGCEVVSPCGCCVHFPSD